MRACGRVGGAGIGHLFSQGKSEVGVFSQITGTRSLYRSRTRADSAMRCSKECSRLCAKLIRMGWMERPNGARPGISSMGAIPANAQSAPPLIKREGFKTPAKGHLPRVI